jgi:FkbM family methyltransferase
VLARAAASRRNVELNQLALGDVPGSFDFFRNAEPMTNSLLSTSAEAVQGEVGPLMATREKIAVGVTTLDEFCTSRHIKRIDVLKTDCQGFDLRVLKGAQRMLEEQRVELILCEAILDSLYAGQGWFDEIIGFLRSWRYALCAIYHPARNSRFEFTFGEALFRLRRGTRVTHD